MKTNQFQEKLLRNLEVSSNKTFLEHFQELKNRLLVWFAVFVVFSCLGYFLKDQIFSILLAPLNQSLYFSSPSGAFSFTFSVALFFGFVISLPLLIYEIIIFIVPAVPLKTKSITIEILISSAVFMIDGVLFAYFVSLPAALNFLLNFGGSQVKSLISTSEYFSFISAYLIGFGILFQLPLILFFINSIRKIETRQLFNFERWVILISFVVAAVLTPTPDIANQIFMAVPIILLYQLSILVIWYVNRNSS